jgi:hypothetical protein
MHFGLFLAKQFFVHWSLRSRQGAAALTNGAASDFDRQVLHTGFRRIDCSREMKAVSFINRRSKMDVYSELYARAPKDVVRICHFFETKLAS